MEASRNRSESVNSIGSIPLPSSYGIDLDICGEDGKLVLDLGLISKSPITIGGNCTSDSSITNSSIGSSKYRGNNSDIAYTAATLVNYFGDSDFDVDQFSFLETYSNSNLEFELKYEDTSKIIINNDTNICNISSVSSMSNKSDNNDSSNNNSNNTSSNNSINSNNSNNSNNSSNNNENPPTKGTTATKNGRYKHRSQYKCGNCGLDKIKGNHTCQFASNKRSRVDIVQELIYSDVTVSPIPSLNTVSESILKSILNLTPFDLIEFFVPYVVTCSVSNLVLQCCYSNNEDLKTGWRGKSKPFGFRPNEGLIGRVSKSRKFEIIEDLSNASEDVFMRAEAAKQFGLQTCVALAQQSVPVNNVTEQLSGVFVFYSVSKFQLTEHFISFLKDIVEHINI